MFNLLKSDFNKNILTLVTGTTIAQAIPIAISPILTRIYSPEEFGIFSLFLSFSLILGSIANGRYEMAIMLPEKDEDALNLVFLGILISTAFSLFLMLFLFIFNKDILFLLKDESLKGWLYFVPIVVFFIGSFNVLMHYNNRKKYYKDIAKANVIKSFFLGFIQLTMPFVKKGVFGLIAGYIVSQFSANMKLVKNILLDKFLVKKINKKQIISLAKKYKKFPQFSLLATFANTLSLQFGNVLIGSLYSTKILGFYSLGQKVLGMPISLIGGAISQVYYQESVVEKTATGKTVKTFTKTVKKLLIIAFPIFLILYFIIEDLFVFVYGNDWRIAGVYSKILIPLYFIRFLSSTVSQILSIFEKQKVELLINMILLIIFVILLSLFKNDFMFFLKIYSIIISFCYLCFLFYYYKLSKGQSF